MTITTSSYKTTSGHYTITCADGYGNLYVNGNLIVSGASANVIPSTITESFITVAANNTGAVTDMGILAQTGGGNVPINQTFAGLRFDSIANAWQISSSVDAAGNPISPYLTLSTGNVSVAGLDTQVQFNNGGDFGGAANLTYTVNGGATAGSQSILALNGLEKFNQIGLTAQGNVVFTANASYLFSNPVQSGGTGLYFVSPNPTDPLQGVADELISKTKAIVYSIIF